MMMMMMAMAMPMPKLLHPDLLSPQVLPHIIRILPIRIILRLHIIDLVTKRISIQIERRPVLTSLTSITVNMQVYRFREVGQCFSHFTLLKAMSILL